MKFLEGKTPAERNKIIAAIVLGGVAIIALSYTLSGFFFPTQSSSRPKPTPTPSPTAERVAVNGNDPTITISPEEIPWLTTPVSYRPVAFSLDAGRNIFAFYEPPPPTPWSPTPYVEPSRAPLPTPPPPTVILGYVSPSSIYAGSKGFRLELMGDKFTPEVKVIFNGGELPTNFINSQKLTADIPASLIAGDGSRSIMVRSPDNKLWSNQLMMQVQPPPVPNFEYIGLVEKKRRNDDKAILREKGKTETNGFRLNDTVGDRFRLISISSREVILEDRNLGFRHRLPFSEGKSSGSTGTGVGIGGFGRGNNGQLPIYSYPGGPNPVTIQPGENPQGIPANIPRYVPPNANSNRPQNTKKDYEDDDDDGDNRRP